MGEKEMDEIADIISNVIRNINNPSLTAEMNKKVKALCEKYPIYTP
jgi:glycine hydroxymethyltransferase